MAMLATLEGDEIQTDYYALDRLFTPNDGLGVELLGVDGWNAAKRKAANIAMNAIKKRRLFIVPEIVYCDQMDQAADFGTAKALFGLDVDYGVELLGYSPMKSLSKGLKKVVSEVGKAVTAAPQKIISTANPVKGARTFAKSQLKLLKKYTKPSQALKLSLFPTEQLKAISSSDVTGVSQAVTKAAAKVSPDLMPYELTKKTVKKAAYSIPVMRKAYKAGETVVRTTDYISPGGAAEATESPVVQYITGAGSSGNRDIESPEVTEESSWASLINWKTLAVGGLAAWLIFGRRGNKRGRR